MFSVGAPVKELQRDRPNECLCQPLRISSESGLRACSARGGDAWGIGVAACAFLDAVGVMEGAGWCVVAAG